jgi:hypothetical protein
MRVLARLLFFLAPLLVVAVPPAAAQGMIEGTLQIGSDTVPLTHVYARESVPRPGSDEAAHVIILMTDRPAPPEVQASRRAYYAAAREGRIRGALLVLEPDPRFVLFAPGGAQIDTEVPDVFERISLSDLRRDGASVSGQLQMTEADELPFGDDGSTFIYRVDARFSAPVVAAPRATATLTGMAARDSPQAQAAERILEVIHRGSVAEVQRVLLADHPAWSQLGSGDVEFALAMMREFLPAPATFRQSIERITVYDDLAVISARDADGITTTTVSLRRVGDEWKMAQTPIAND